MLRFLRQFRMSLIATTVALFIMLAVGMYLLTGIIRSGGGNTNERAEILGKGLAIVTCIIITPFWIYDAYEAGKVRREALKKTSTKPKPTTPRKKSRR